MFGGVVGGSVLPAVPDDVEPGAGEDADRVGVVVAAGDRAAIEVSGTGVGVSAVAGEVGDRVAELFVCGPTESDVFDFIGLAGGGGDSGQACQRFRGGEPGAASRALIWVPRHLRCIGDLSTITDTRMVHQ